MGSEKPGGSGTNSISMKEKSVRVFDDGFTSKELLEAVVEDIDVDGIVGCVKVGGQWVITLKDRQDADLLMETGLQIAGRPFAVQGVTKNIITVSLFGVPSYVTDDELNIKLREYGCIMKSAWTHKTFPEFPTIENGTRFVRLELPNDKKSLPYAIIINGVHLRLKHNGQVLVCNLCLADDHIMKNCPSYKCRECNNQGHSESRCPTVLCYACKKRGHKSFACPENDRQRNLVVEMDTDNARPDVNTEMNTGHSESPVTSIVECAHSVGLSNTVVKETLSSPPKNKDENPSKPPDSSTTSLSNSKDTSEDHPTKRSLSCDESEEDKESSQSSQSEASQSSKQLFRPKKHITPNLLMARNFTPNKQANDGSSSANTY
ncbi:hypothetical protein HOLleu_43089 [Holothuria leucospilota]|uniref:CCHC-type domain-containing protein n=1 Tax=Holothuria leucospilota TaxID=206669 RepID=A0A9Q0YB11_HOLLE|nr:hypothetical protein HOLleu_43089 [Holothuria leucospilota]